MKGVRSKLWTGKWKSKGLKEWKLGKSVNRIQSLYKKGEKVVEKFKCV